MGIFQLAMLVYSRVTPTTTLFLLPKAVVKTPPDRRLRTSIVVLRPLRKWWGLAFGTWQRSTLGWKLHKYTLWGGELCVFFCIMHWYRVIPDRWWSPTTFEFHKSLSKKGHPQNCQEFIHVGDLCGSFVFHGFLGCESRWITRFCKWLWKYFRMIFKIRFTRWAPTSHKVITPISRVIRLVISHNPYTHLFSAISRGYNSIYNWWQGPPCIPPRKASPQDFVPHTTTEEVGWICDLIYKKQSSHLPHLGQVVVSKVFCFYP